MREKEDKKTKQDETRETKSSITYGRCEKLTFLHISMENWLSKHENFDFNHNMIYRNVLLHCGGDGVALYTVSNYELTIKKQHSQQQENTLKRCEVFHSIEFLTS